MISLPCRWAKIFYRIRKKKVNTSSGKKLFLRKRAPPDWRRASHFDFYHSIGGRLLIILSCVEGGKTDWSNIAFSSRGKGREEGASCWTNCLNILAGGKAELPSSGGQRSARTGGLRVREEKIEKERTGGGYVMLSREHHGPGKWRRKKNRGADKERNQSLRERRGKNPVGESVSSRGGPRFSKKFPLRRSLLSKTNPNTHPPAGAPHATTLPKETGHKDPPPLTPPRPTSTAGEARPPTTPRPQKYLLRTPQRQKNKPHRRQRALSPQRETHQSTRPAPPTKNQRRHTKDPPSTPGGEAPRRHPRKPTTQPNRQAPRTPPPGPLKQGPLPKKPLRPHKIDRNRTVS